MTWGEGEGKKHEKEKEGERKHQMIMEYIHTTYYMLQATYTGRLLSGRRVVGLFPLTYSVLCLPLGLFLA